MTTSNNKPEAKKPVYRKVLPNNISAAVFENVRDGRTYRSINLQRSYRKDGNWNRMSLYLDHEHIPFVIEALQGTWQFLNNAIGATLPNDASTTVENVPDDAVAEIIPDTEIA
jgi:hypothetical protein